MSTSLFAYSPVDSAVHAMQLDAIVTYAEQAGIESSQASGRPRWSDLMGSRDRRVVIQSAGLWNLVAVPLLRLRSSEVIYYLHEPSALKTKISRGNGTIKSLVWQLVQRLDIRLATKIIVSREELRQRTQDVYGTNPKKIEIAPLLVLPRLGDNTDGVAEHLGRYRITYLGRIDERRYLREFIALAKEFIDAGYQPTILTPDVGAIDALDIPSTIDVIAQRNFSEKTKAEILNSTAVVWNPKSYEIAQSAVTIDALRYGCQIVLTDGDPECANLEEHGIAVRFDGEDVVDLTALEEADALAGAATSLFAQRHGEHAFVEHYLPLLNGADS